MLPRRSPRRSRRSPFWHEPERLAGQELRDAQLGRDSFYVYVLATDYGHYVGHTWSVGSRLREHRAGRVRSTAGGNPSLLWQSRPLSSRADAARFEASLKSLRDQRALRYAEIVGFDPVPFVSYDRRASAGAPLGFSGVLALLAVVAACLLVLLIVAILAR